MAESAVDGGARSIIGYSILEGEPRVGCDPRQEAEGSHLLSHLGVSRLKLVVQLPDAMQYQTSRCAIA
jgi:hypothetical protein